MSVAFTYAGQHPHSGATNDLPPVQWGMLPHAEVECGDSACGKTSKPRARIPSVAGCEPRAGRKWVTPDGHRSRCTLGRGQRVRDELLVQHVVYVPSQD
jgi:hypothetical protein